MPISPTTQRLIEKKSGVKLNDFPDSDFEKVDESLKEHKKIEVWLMKGMGRYYITPVVRENKYNFPIMQKLCDLSLGLKHGKKKRP